MKILEELKNFKCGNEDFERGFATAINIIEALDKSNGDSIEDLRREIAKLQLRIAKLECDKQPYRWYPYVTYCDATAPASSGTIYNTIVTCDKKSK